MKEEITCSEYVKSWGFKTLREFVTLISGVEKDLNLEEKLRRWYKTNRMMFDCLIIGAFERRKANSTKLKGRSEILIHESNSESITSEIPKGEYKAPPTKRTIKRLD